MPLCQYFGWVGSVLLAALIAANWYLPAPSASSSDVSPDQNINIRIHTDHKWPERVVFDTKATMAAQRAGVETGIGESEAAVVADHQVLDAFAAMAAIPVRPCFRPPCSPGAAAGRENSRSGKAAPFRARLAVRKELTFPSRLQKPPGRS